MALLSSTMQLKQVPIQSTIFLLSLGHSSQCLHVWERERGVRFCESRKEEGIRQKKEMPHAASYNFRAEGNFFAFKTQLQMTAFFECIADAF